MFCLIVALKHLWGGKLLSGSQGLLALILCCTTLQRSPADQTCSAAIELLLLDKTGDRDCCVLRQEKIRLRASIVKLLSQFNSYYFWGP